MKAVIKAIEYHLPSKVLTNAQLYSEVGDWTPRAIEEKTGIYILLCTQSPDYFLPTTACLLQDRLKLRTSCGALDFNLGCSGFVYGLGLAKGLIETGQARNVLLITAETYSKFLHPRDMSVRTIFGDAGAATLIVGIEPGDTSAGDWIGPLVVGTDGSGADNLIVREGGMRYRQASNANANCVDRDESQPTAAHLFMDGAEIFSFTLEVVPQCVKKLLSRARKSVGDVDLFVFHQANEFMLNHLRKKMKIAEEKFYVSMRNVGNTVSASIPIALKDAHKDGRLRPGDCVAVVGFGVGYSWAAALVRWYF